MLVNLNQEYFNIAVFVVLSVILSSVLLLLSYSISYKKKMILKKYLRMSVVLNLFV